MPPVTATKLFFIVFAAVLLGNLATLGIEHVSKGIGHGSIAGPTKTVADFLKGLEQPEKGNIGVSFKNKASNWLSCSILDKGDYVNFLRLAGNEEKHFDNFIAGSKARCSIQIDNKASTMLSYFEVTAAGDYVFSLDKVPCSSCTGQDWRWATVFVDPQGRSDYTHFQ